LAESLAISGLAGGKGDPPHRKEGKGLRDTMFKKKGGGRAVPCQQRGSSSAAERGR